MDELADRYPPLNGGACCLDFVNTLEPGADGGRDRDHLGTDYSGVLSWSAYAGLIDAGTERRLRTRAATHPQLARWVAAEAHDLRAQLLATFTAVAAGDPLPPAALAGIGLAYADALAAGTLRSTGSAAHWSWDDADDAGDADLRAPLRPIAVSAIDLLTGDQTERVKHCAGCPVLFLDTTRNGSRRWCLMRYCGNVQKSRRQARQRRAARAAGRQVSNL